MRNNPPENSLVSIIIPTHNREDLIVETLKSIEAQEYKQIEVILVDDHSTDNTRDVIKRFVDDGRINIVMIESDGYGSNHARNLGLKRSHGEFVAFFDDDDIMRHDFISARIDYFKDPDIDFVGCDFVHFEGNIENVISKRCLSSIPHNIVSHIYYMGLPTQSFLLRRRCAEKLGYWNERVKRMQDVAYFHRLFLYEQKGKYVPLTLFYYRIHNNTITKNNQCDAQLFAYDEIGKEWKNEGRYNEIKNVLMLGQYIFLREQWQDNKVAVISNVFRYLPLFITMLTKKKIQKKNDNQILNGLIY